MAFQLRARVVAKEILWKAAESQVAGKETPEASGCQVNKRDRDEEGACWFKLTLYAPEVAAVARPGQFVHIKAWPGHDPLLRRPFSIAGVDRLAGMVILLVREVGRATAIMRCLQPGMEVDLLAPLGRGFTLPLCRGKDEACDTEALTAVALRSVPSTGGFSCQSLVVVLAGGAGIAPLLFLLQELAVTGGYWQGEEGKELKALPRVRVIWGARTVQELAAVEELRRIVALLPPGMAEIFLTTDDGSSGRRGTAVDALQEWFTFSQHGSEVLLYLYACGPLSMLKATASLLKDFQSVRNRNVVVAEFALEARMGCAVGACLGCAVPAAGGGYRMVCREGPVFDYRCIDWDKL